MKKEIFYCLAILISMVSFSQEEGDEFNRAGVRYAISSIGVVNQVIAVGPGNSLPVDLVIPETVSYLDLDLEVTAIGGDAFKGNKLKSITLPSTVAIIGSGAFQNNKIESVTIPSSVTTIEINAFRNNSLVNVVFSEGLTAIKSTAFKDNKLKSITLPNTVTIIGFGAFQDNLIESVTIPSSVTTIERSAFENNSLVNVLFSEGLTTIKSAAFKTNKLKSITFPSSVTFIDTDVFKENKNDLESITAEGLVPAKIIDDSFGNRSEINLFVPEGMESDYVEAGWTGFKSILGKLIVYPNPVLDKLYLKGAISNSIVKIYNLSGVLVKKPLKLKSQVDPVFVVDLVPGMYFLQLISGRSVRTTKFIKQ